MAFMNRGDFPSIDHDDIGGMQENNWGGNCYHRRYGYRNRDYYYIPLNNTYVIMQMIVAFMILIVGVFAFITTYQSTIVDPIENTKKLFMNTCLILMAVILVLTFVIHIFSKSEGTQRRRLVGISILSIIIMLVFCGIKMKFDTTYTEDRFKQFYQEQNSQEASNGKNKIDIGLLEVSIKTEQEYYVDECMKLYHIFGAKTYAILGVHLVLNLLLIYRIIKVSHIQGKKDKLKRDDLILFDEEENVKT